MTDNAVFCEIQRASQAPNLPEDAWFTQCVSLAMQEEVGELTVRIVDEEEMQGLNAEHRGQDKTTNVLSFPAEFPPELEMTYLGDIAVCAQVVAREAESQGKPLAHHWAHMLIHGVLHLRGFDHVQEGEAQEMEALEIELLAKLDIANPYE